MWLQGLDSGKPERISRLIQYSLSTYHEIMTEALHLHKYPVFRISFMVRQFV